MSVSGINTGFAKCFILFMALAIMLQGFIYLALSLWGLVLTNCNNQQLELLEGDLTRSPLRFFFDIIYFKNEICGSRSLYLNNQTYILNVDWTQSEIITHRELIIFMAYIAVSAVWIVSSLLVIATLCGKLTILVTVLCFWPWFIFVIAGCILDVVATVYHSIDIAHTTTTQDALQYVGLENIDSNVRTTLNRYDSYYMIPAVVMASISSRAVLIWLLNAFGSIFCITLCQAINNKQRHQPTRNIVSTAGLELNTEIARNLEQEPTAPRETPGLKENGVPRTPNGVQATTTPVRMEADSSYRNTDAHPERLNYPKITSLAIPTTPASLSFASPLNLRYSSMESMPSTPVQASVELRNQMPWSYTSMAQQQQQPPQPNQRQQQQQQQQQPQQQ